MLALVLLRAYRATSEDERHETPRILRFIAYDGEIVPLPPNEYVLIEYHRYQILLLCRL